MWKPLRRTSASIATIALLACGALPAQNAQFPPPPLELPEPAPRPSAAPAADAQAPDPDPSPSEAAPAAVDDDPKVYRVPIFGSPVRGKPTALATLVAFSDFQCAPCAAVQPVLREVAGRYGDALRIVHKHRPMPPHARAEPAAQLSIDAWAQKGDAGFWRVHDALFAQQQHLDDPTLAEIAKDSGINVPSAVRAVEVHRYAARIDEDEDLADDLEVPGVPYLFLNGRRVGAPPIEKLCEHIDAELAKARALVKTGVAPIKVYDRIQAGAAPMPGKPLARTSLPAPASDAPSRGPGSARVVVQMFGDFLSAPCKWTVRALEELDRAFPGLLRVVWRSLPEAGHELPAEAAMEAFAQKGDKGFWAMHDLMFAVDERDGVIDRAAIDRLAAQLGLDAAKLSDALDAHAHRARIEADGKLARGASITAAPGLVINGYVLRGAQPISKLKRAVRLALAEAR